MSGLELGCLVVGGIILGGIAFVYGILRFFALLDFLEQRKISKIAQNLTLAHERVERKRGSFKGFCEEDCCGPLKDRTTSEPTFEPWRKFL